MLCDTCGRGIVKVCTDMVECHRKGTTYYFSKSQAPSECLHYVSYTQVKSRQQLFLEEVERLKKRNQDAGS